MLTRLEISVDRPAAYDGGPLVSRTWRPVDDPDSPLRRVPSSRFDTCATAPETRPLPAVKRAHPPGARNDDQLSSGVRPGRGAILRPVVQGPIGHCASPYPPPDVLRCFGYATAGCVIVRRRQWGPASPIPLRPAESPT